MRRILALAGLLLLVAGGVAEAQCLSTPQASRRSLQIGQDWVRNSCRRGVDADCVDVINSVIRSIGDLEGCPGFAPGEVNGVVARLRAMAGQGSPAARQEAEDRYEERMKPPPARPYVPYQPPAAPPAYRPYGNQPAWQNCQNYTLNMDGTKYCF